MKIKTNGLAIVLVVLFLGGIFASDIAGVWKTESSKVVDVIKIGSSIGQGDPKDIKGSFSFLDITNNFDIPISKLEQAFEIKNVEDINNFKCKDLESYYGESNDKEIGTNSVRLFVALYKGIDFEVNEETYLPEAAVKILKDEGVLSEEQLEYIDQHSVILSF